MGSSEVQEKEEMWNVEEIEREKEEEEYRWEIFTDYFVFRIDILLHVVSHYCHFVIFLLVLHISQSLLLV